MLSVYFAPSSSSLYYILTLPVTVCVHIIKCRSIANTKLPGNKGDTNICPSSNECCNGIKIRKKTMAFYNGFLNISRCCLWKGKFRLSKNLPRIRLQYVKLEVEFSENCNTCVCHYVMNYNMLWKESLVFC